MTDEDVFLRLRVRHQQGRQQRIAAAQAAVDVAVQMLAVCPVTLNGCPATVAGFGEPYATVAALPDGPRHEWAWETVLHVLQQHGGAFRS